MSADGLAVVDKPAGPTSHAVVARVRRLAGTRRVGHAGTLDPLATGVLLVGVGRATRLLGYLAEAGKSYRATVRLGQATSTDDADGEVLSEAGAEGVSAADVERAAAALTGAIRQRPPVYSAVKVAGRRAYARARAGESVALPDRAVNVYRLAVAGARPVGRFLDAELEVDCSAGTYVRALARDIGEALGVGGHLRALRRTRVGGFDLSRARPLDAPLELLPLPDVVREVFGELRLSDPEGRALANGRAVPLADAPPGGAGGLVGAFAADGTLLALVRPGDGAARPVVVFAPGGTL